MPNAKLQQLIITIVLDDEEFDDDNEVDQVDGEFTPLARGIDIGRSVTRFNPDKSKDDDVLNSTDHNPDRRLVPSGFYPQWPTYYPDVSINSFI